MRRPNNLQQTQAVHFGRRHQKMRLARVVAASLLGVGGVGGNLSRGGYVGSLFLFFTTRENSDRTNRQQQRNRSQFHVHNHPLESSTRPTKSTILKRLGTGSKAPANGPLTHFKQFRWTSLNKNRSACRGPQDSTPTAPTADAIRADPPTSLRVPSRLPAAPAWLPLLNTHVRDRFTLRLVWRPPSPRPPGLVRGSCCIRSAAVRSRRSIWPDR